MIIISAILTASVAATRAQEQEAKLVDRILRPNLSLVNSAQGKQFGADGIFIANRARSKSFHTPNTSPAKSFSADRAFSSRQFATRRFRTGDTTANIATRSELTKTDTVGVASAAYGTRVAPEGGRSMSAAPFAGSRPFLGQGKSQKALRARDTPLTIEQVRELLNKNK